VITGVIDHGPPNSAQALGAEFLFKPYTLANLRAFLARALAPASTESVRVSAVDDLIALHDLSDRESALVRCVARGVPRADLAEVLGVSDNTVKTHVRRLLKKTGHKDLAHLHRELAGPIR
jgi:two-component system vancomycin resistance associated response regulator VraR